MDGRKYFCKCGKKYGLFTALLRHVDAFEFSYGCMFCVRIYISQAHRLRHHRKCHPDHPEPNKDDNVADNASTMLHSTTDEIECQRLRQKRLQKRRQKSRTSHSSPLFVPIPIVPAPITLQDNAAAHWSSDVVDWLVNPNVPTPQPLQNNDDPPADERCS